MALDPITAALDIGGKLIDKLWPNPEQAAEAKIKLVELQQSGELAQLTAETDLAKSQIEVNKIEASSVDPFVSRWRPAIGWVCAAAFAYTAVLQPFLVLLLRAAGNSVVLPALDGALISAITLSLLGMGGMRSYDKKQGTSK